MNAALSFIRHTVQLATLVALCVLLFYCWKIDDKLNVAAEKAKAVEEALEASRSNLREWKSDFDKALKLPRDLRGTKP